MIFASHDSPVGALTLVSDGQGLAGVYFPSHKKSGRPPPTGPVGEDAILTQARRELDAYFEGRRRTFETPLRPVGTAFQVQVWTLLRAIPYGRTQAYGAIAALLDKPNAARAVGAAVGANPISIIVPCHRVVGASGALTGFAGGLERKRMLLSLENGQTSLVSA